MSFWHFNPADPVADAIHPGWRQVSGPGFATGVGFAQRSLPTFIELTTGPTSVLAEGLHDFGVYDQSAFGTFLLSRLYTHSAGLLSSPDIRRSPFDRLVTEFPEWVSREVGEDRKSRWRVVCRELWVLSESDLSEPTAVPYRVHGWWAFWGTWNRTVISSPPFAYGTNALPHDDDFNPCFGGRRQATALDTTGIYRMPAWVDLKPWFP